MPRNRFRTDDEVKVRIGDLMVSIPRHPETVPDGKVDRPVLSPIVGVEAGGKGALKEFEHFHLDYEADLRLETLTRTVYVQPQYVAEQHYVQDFLAACHEMDKGDAGRRAFDLLMSHLTPEQQASVIAFNTFSSTHIHPEADWFIKQRMRVPIWTALFHRGNVCGNITLIAHHRREAPPVILCIHPPSPYPMDDIILAQKIMWDTNPEEMLKIGNLTLPGSQTLVPLSRFFTPVEELLRRRAQRDRKRLFVPTVHERNAAK